MKKSGLISSFLATTLLFTGLYANDYVVYDENTTGIVLQNNDSLSITSKGSVIFLFARDDVVAVDSNATGDIVNFGYIKAESNSTYDGGFVSAIMQYQNANDITNSGTIEVNTTSSSLAIGIGQMNDSTVESYNPYIYYTHMDVVSNILNKGEIIVTSGNQATGIFEVLGDVVNSGTIIARAEQTPYTQSSYATGIYQNYGNVLNSGDIITIAQGRESVGIKSIEGNITNTGTITAENSSGGSLGIKAISNINDLYVFNSGSINANSSNSYYSTGINTFSYYKDIYVTNDGTIIAENNSSNYANANAILSYGFNKQTIINSGDLIAIGKNQAIANGVYVNTAYDTSVTNFASIITQSDLGNSNGIFFENTAQAEASIDNSGSIEAQSNSYYATGIYGYNTSNVKITNSGIIKASGEEGYTVGIAIYGHDGSANITNSGSIIADKAFDIENQAYIQNSGLIDTNYMLASSSTLVNSGIIRLHNPIHSLMDSVSKLDVFTQTASATLGLDALIEEDNGAVSILSPKIDANTSVNIENGSGIDVNVISSDNTLIQTFLENNGTIDSIITSNGDMNVSVDKLNITDNSPIMDFKAYISNQSELSLKAVKTEKLKQEDSPMSALSSLTAVATTLDTTGDIVQSRQEGARGLNSGDMAFKDRHIWFKPFGTYTKQDDKDAINGFDASTYGFGIGLDGEYKEGKRAGFAFFYSNTNLDVNNVTQSNDIDMFSFMAYGSNPIIDDKTLLFYQTGFGVQRNSTQRYISTTSQTAKADYTSKSFFIEAKATRDYSLNEKIVLTPAIKALFRYLTTPSYSESGAGIYNLNIKSSSDTQVVFGVSTNLSYKIDETTKVISNVALDYNFYNDARSVDVYFQGAPDITFNTEGIENSALGYGFDLGISKELKKNLDFTLRYSLSGRGEELINHSVSAKFRWKF